jgi:RIO-like serine/threonine protein kinase
MLMDSIDVDILKAIETVSPKRSISPVKVNEVLKLDETELGKRLMQLKKSGHVDILISDYPSSLTLPNAISKVFLTELGRKILEGGQ